MATLDKQGPEIKHAVGIGTVVSYSEVPDQKTLRQGYRRQQPASQPAPRTMIGADYHMRDATAEETAKKSVADIVGKVKDAQVKSTPKSAADIAAQIKAQLDPPEDKSHAPTSREVEEKLLNPDDVVDEGDNDEVENLKESDNDNKPEALKSVAIKPGDTVYLPYQKTEVVVKAVYRDGTLDVVLNKGIATVRSAEVMPLPKE